MWTWVTNADPKDIDGAVERNAKFYGGPARGGASRWPGDLYTVADPGECKPGRYGQVGVYVDGDAWIAWFKRTNPNTSLAHAQAHVSDLIPRPGYYDALEPPKLSWRLSGR